MTFLFEIKNFYSTYILYGNFERFLDLHNIINKYIKRSIVWFATTFVHSKTGTVFF